MAAGGGAQPTREAKAMELLTVKAGPINCFGLRRHFAADPFHTISVYMQTKVSHFSMLCSARIVLLSIGTDFCNRLALVAVTLDELTEDLSDEQGFWLMAELTST